MNNPLSKPLMLAAFVAAALACTPALAAKKSKVAGDDDMSGLLEMSDQLDRVDVQDFQAAIERATSCTRARDFICAESELARAAKSANGGQDKKILLASRQSLADEKQELANEIRRAEEARRREEERERERLAAQEAEEERMNRAEMFRGILNTVTTTWQEADARDRKQYAEMEASIARGQAAGEAERRRREEAEAKAEAARRYRMQGQVAQYQPATQSQARTTEQSTTRQARLQEEAGQGERVRSIEPRPASVMTGSSDATPPVPPRKQAYTEQTNSELPSHCRWEVRKGPWSGPPSGDRASAESALKLEAGRRFCVLATHSSAHRLVDIECDSEPVYEQSFKEGKLTSKEVGTRWQCHGIVECEKPEKKCDWKPVGASRQ